MRADAFLLPLVLLVAAPGTAPATLGAGTQTSAPPRQAVLDTLREVTGSLNGIEGALTKRVSRLRAQEAWLANAEVVTRHVEQTSAHVKWLRGALESATTLTKVASEAGDSDMELGVLRMTGPKLQAAMLGTLLLATWIDFLQLADASIRHCPMCGAEQLSADLHQVQGWIQPSMNDLQSLDPKRVERAATAMPELMGTLTQEFARLRENTRAVMKLGEKVVPAPRVLETMTLLSPLEASLPRSPSATPVPLDKGLVLHASGVMAGSRLVVSTDRMKRMRRLVQAGVLSLSTVRSIIHIHGGQVMTAQARQDLPEDVRNALGASPEGRSVHVSEAPKHPVLPQEHREWFEQRGFKGDTDIDQFSVPLEPSRPEATPGDWKLGHMSPGEWNRVLMQALREAELSAGRRLTRSQVLHVVAGRMKEHKVPMTFVTETRH
ncbi:DUF2380 domain-containing protein [Myxococcus stipitatus]|uniref:DUF2380 domain-containing protein n=1 Tax=Myxococcus stipitatus TaxID=83455 RepID=UPI003144E144